MPGIPKTSGAVAAPLPYLLRRRWRRRLQGPAVLSWFRAAERGLCASSDAVGRARAGAALGAGRRGRGGVGGWGVGVGEERRPPPTQAAGRTATPAADLHSSRAVCTTLPNPLATSARGRQPHPAFPGINGVSGHRGEISRRLGVVGGRGEETQSSSSWAGLGPKSSAGMGGAPCSAGINQADFSFWECRLQEAKPPAGEPEMGHQQKQGGVQAAARPTERKENVSQLHSE